MKETVKIKLENKLKWYTFELKYCIIELFITGFYRTVMINYMT